MKALLFLSLLNIVYSSGDCQYRNFGFIPTPTCTNAYNVGDTLDINWYGGDLSWNVSLALIDLTNWVVQTGITDNFIPNSRQQYSWVIPAKGSNGYPLRCNNIYGLYVQNQETTQWTYGPPFMLVNGCESQDQDRKKQPSSHLRRVEDL